MKYLPLPEVTRQEVRSEYADGIELDKIIDGEHSQESLPVHLNVAMSLLGTSIRGPLCSRENRSDFGEEATPHNRMHGI